MNLSLDELKRRNNSLPQENASQEPAPPQPSYYLLPTESWAEIRQQLHSLKAQNEALHTQLNQLPSKAD
ncbi:MAG: hypothetical protein RSC88_09750, partial [Oscillospiraceae bacterium]